MLLNYDTAAPVSFFLCA